MIFSTFVIQTIKVTHISMKDLCYVYTTAIFSMFLIKSIRATEHCTKYLRYIYTTKILSTILIITTTLSMFFIKSIRATEYCTKSLCYVYMITTTIFFFLFKIFLEIFKNMKNANVSLFFEWTKEKKEGKVYYFHEGEHLVKFK